MFSVTGWLYRYPVLGTIILVLTVTCIVHAIANRKDFWWIWVILFVPGIGATIYFFQEILPTLRRRRVNLDPIVENLRGSEARIKRRREELDEADTLKNRVALAAEYARAARYAEAEETLRPLTTGIYRDDPEVLYQLADLAYRQEKYQEARERLESLERMRSQATQARALTLLAETLEKLGEAQTADDTYGQAMRVATSEEPRVKYARFLIQQGRRDEARALLEQVQKTYRRANNLYRSQEREWFRLAEQLRQTLTDPSRPK